MKDNVRNEKKPTKQAPFFEGVQGEHEGHNLPYSLYKKPDSLGYEISVGK